MAYGDEKKKKRQYGSWDNPGNPRWMQNTARRLKQPGETTGGGVENNISPDPKTYSVPPRTAPARPVNLDLGRTAQERGFTPMSARPERTPLAGPAQTPTTNSRAVPDRTVVTNTLPSNPNTLMQTPQSRDLLSRYGDMNPQQLQEHIAWLNKNDMIPGNTHIIRGMKQEFNEWGTGKKFDTYVDFLRGKTAEDRTAEGAALDRQMELEKERIKASGKAANQGPDPYKVATDEMSYVQEAVSALGNYATPEELTAAANIARLQFKQQTGQLIPGTDKETGERVFRTQDGMVLDAQGNDITNQFQQPPPARTPQPDQVSMNYGNQIERGREVVANTRSNYRKLGSWFDDFGGRSDWRNRDIG